MATANKKPYVYWKFISSSESQEIFVNLTLVYEVTQEGIEVHIMQAAHDQ